MRALPSVSIVAPILNEESHLRDAVSAMLAQDYDGPLEIVLAVGPSRDRTGEVAAELAAADDRVRVVDNPSGRTPQGLNLAIAASTGEIVVRCDGHALLPTSYVRTAVDTLARTGADNVGGVMAAEGITDFEQAVARAMRTRLGVGPAAFHVGGHEGEAPTVYLGAFRRSALERVGGYDETMTRAQDWEMNHRIRSSGGTVWFTPQMQVVYRPRGSLRALARQYRDYGRWRRVVMRRHPETAELPASLRYYAPPAMVSAVAAGSAIGVAGLIADRPALTLALLAPAGYAALVVGGAIALGRGLPTAARLQLPAVYATMHWSWGWGFLTSPPALAAVDAPDGDE